jgi:esterase/lipase superfamily enzyme
MRTAKHTVVLLVLLAALGACSSRPTGVLASNPKTAPGATPVSMIVATTRARADDNTLFSGERARRVSLAEITISIPPASNRKVGEVQWPRQLPANPETEFSTLSAAVVDLPQAQATLRRMLARQRHGHVMVFVHGYNNRFENAVYSLAQISHDSGAPAVPVLFTWPSRGRLLDYGYDRESANYSRDALEGLLTSLNRNPGVREISVLAHSMGNWVTLEALRQMAIRNGRVAPKIKDVMLAAPDVDVDVFRSQINQIGDKRPAFTLFASQDDRALAISRRLWGSTQRLGAVNPNEEPYRTDLARDGITVVDLTTVKAGDQLNHGKFAESPAVVRMIGQRLAGGQDLANSEVSLTDRIGLATASTGAAIGGAAGLIISAPLAVISADERKSHEDTAREVADRTREAVGATTRPAP